RRSSSRRSCSSVCCAIAAPIARGSDFLGFGGPNRCSRSREPGTGYPACMARPIWTGSLSFGLVNVPVGIYSAIEQKDIRFHQFQQGTKRRIHNQRVAEGTKKEGPYETSVMRSRFNTPK